MEEFEGTYVAEDGDCVEAVGLVLEIENDVGVRSLERKKADVQSLSTYMRERGKDTHELSGQELPP